VDTDATSIVLPGQAGVMEVLPGAAPLMTAIGAGLLTVRGGGEGDQTFVVARGFAEVLPDRVTVLTEYAEMPDAVDKQAAQQLLDDGQKAVQEAGQDPARYDRARLMVVEAEAKLGTTEK
jgi:F-type H+-transporting ATPase subunit epsilon